MGMLSEATHYIVLALNIFSIGILLVGTAKAIWGFLVNEAKGGDRFDVADKNNKIKIYLGSYILLSLEVLIASDIIETIMSPTLDDILILAGIVVIRTTISYFLGKEIEQAEKEHQ